MRSLRNEDEIIANWKGDLDKPVLSICCITYNHESYIEDALEGFLIQETDFPFEILIHDDASTDRTAEIIREYEAKYPRLIKPIYQNENQYSKGIKIFSSILMFFAKGEYIALCEGDDYWIAADKLQMQVDVMLNHSDIDISFHPAYQVDFDKINRKEIYSNYSEEIKIFSAEEVILGDGGFMPTASLLIKSKKIKSLPDWFFKFAPVGDYYYQMIASIDKGALFIPNIMSCYRVNIIGSWTSLNYNVEKRNKLLAGHFYAFREMNNYYNGAYESCLRTVLTRYIDCELRNPGYNINEKRNLLKKYDLFIKREEFIRFMFLSFIPPFLVILIKKLKKFFI